MGLPFVPVADPETRHNFELLEQMFPLGQQNVAMRTVRGEVTAAGAVARGSGFTAGKNSTGNYTVTFSTAFPAAPIVTVAPMTTAPAARLVSVSAAAFSVETFTAAGANVDSIFDFIVVSA